MALLVESALSETKEGIKKLIGSKVEKFRSMPKHSPRCRKKL